MRLVDRAKNVIVSPKTEWEAIAADATPTQGLVTGYTEAGGLVPDAKDRISEQLKSVANRISSMEARLAIRRAALNKEFIATDQAMSTLNKSVEALSSLGGQYRLF